MPPLHRFLGNPVLSGLGRLFFHSQVGDFHCGLRGFTAEAYNRMELRTTGMEFASEMVIKSSNEKNAAIAARISRMRSRCFAELKPLRRSTIARQLSF